MRCLLLVLASLIIPPSPISADEPGTTWYGTMDVGVRVFRFRITPVDPADADRGYQLVSLDEGVQTFPLDEFRVDDKSMSFLLKVTKAEYSGERSADGTTIHGKWKQSGAEFPLDLRPVPQGYDEPTDEVWSGTIKTLFQKLDVRIRVYQDDEGERVLFDSVTQKAGGFKAARIVEGDQWTIDVTSLGAAFTGTANADRTGVIGTWTQGGIPMDLTLTRTPNAASVEVPKPVRRPQTPQPPFPYTTEDITFRNEADDVTIAGTLCLPASDKPSRAVVMITGSGPQDRDESLLDHKPFHVIADHLARNGIAVLRCDDRGTGESTGDFAQADSRDFARDTAAAVQFLTHDKRIDRRLIGLIGHSEGGIIAPMVAASSNDIAFIVLLAGTGVNGREILISQGQLILKASGVMDAAILNQQKQTSLAMIEASQAAAEDAAPDAIVDDVIRRLDGILSAEELADEMLRPALKAGVEQFRSPWFRLFLTHEPGPVLEKLRCPVLALNGEKDVQVDPQLNLPAIRTALEKNGHTDFEIVELPGLNHLFQTSNTGGVDEYEQIEETFAPAALTKIADWINARQPLTP